MSKRTGGSGDGVLQRRYVAGQAPVVHLVRILQRWCLVLCCAVLCLQALQPRFIPLAGNLEQLLAADPSSLDPAKCCPAMNPDTGITQRRLSNGIRINYRCAAL